MSSRPGRQENRIEEMALPGFTAEKVLDSQRMHHSKSVRGFGGRRPHFVPNAVRQALWSEGGDDSTTDEPDDGFEGFGDPGDAFGDAAGDDSGPGDSWVWPLGG